MLAGLSPLALIAIFVIGAGVIWFAGVRLANTTDVLDTRFGLGEALGGVIVLAIATNLPEIAITASAAWRGDIGIATGNILGGIALQTVVLVGIDAATRGEAPLLRRAASVTLVVEAALVVAVLAVTIMGAQLPARLVAWRMTPGSMAIVLLWLGGVWLVGRSQRSHSWELEGAPKRKDAKSAKEKDARSTSIVLAIFSVAALATLVAGAAIEEASDALAKLAGLDGAVFGATVLAAATSIPELATGITSARIGDDELAVSDIFGGNAFLPVLFALAVAISGEAVLPRASHSDVYLAALGVVLTALCVAGLMLRPTRRLLGVGVDLAAVLVAYLIGVTGLFAIS